MLYYIHTHVTVSSKRSRHVTQTHNIFYIAIVAAGKSLSKKVYTPPPKSIAPLSNKQITTRIRKMENTSYPIRKWILLKLENNHVMLCKGNTSAKCLLKVQKQITL